MNTISIKNRKYSGISKKTINRIKKDLKEKNPSISRKGLKKKIKKELYKIHTAYFKNIDYSKMLKNLKKNPLSTKILLEWLKKYDNNRVKSLQDDMYNKIFRITGKPRTILDVACGLNPLSIPWMNLESNAEYSAYDLEQNLINFLNDYFKLLKKNCKAYLTDVISTPPTKKADVAFIFKASTCFEWQKAGNTMKVVKALNVDYAVISLMMRGEYNLEGCRNYFKKLLGKKFKNSFEVISEKEYFRILKT